MSGHALDTMPRADKRPVAAPPALAGPLAQVAEVVATWPDVTATVHWDLFDPTKPDGVDFYVGDRELGHLHLDGAIHLATSPGLGAALVADGLARPFRYGRGWVCEDVGPIGPLAATALFRRNYDRLVAGQG